VSASDLDAGLDDVYVQQIEPDQLPTCGGSRGDRI
jgi:hypothetical protein